MAPSPQKEFSTPQKEFSAPENSRNGPAPSTKSVNYSFGGEYMQWKFECQLINKAEDGASRLELEQKRKNVIQKGPRGWLWVANCSSHEKVGGSSARSDAGRGPKK